MKKFKKIVFILFLITISFIKMDSIKAATFTQVDSTSVTYTSGSSIDASSAVFKYKIDVLKIDSLNMLFKVLKRNKIRYCILGKCSNVLFEKSYWDVIGPLEYPEATDKEPSDLFYSNGNTFTSGDINDYGTFIYAYKDIETAKKRALRQFQAIYGYVASHFVED